MPDQPYYTHLAAAFVRGKTGVETGSDEELLQLGLQRGLRLHKFRQTHLPRVHKVLGILTGLQPTSLLDIGSGRGASLWPLLDRFPDLPVRVLDVAQRRVDDINAVRAGGVASVEAILGDATTMAEPENAYDVVTALEVLEHMAQPEQACRAILCAAKHYVVAFVPSKPDNNPEHIQYFPRDAFEKMFLDAGARSVKIDHVPNHMIAVVRA